MCLNKSRLTAFIFIFLLVNKARSQQLSNVSLANTQELSYPLSLYYATVGENAHIYNGYEYMTPDRNIKGSPYFIADGPMSASLFYDDSYYLDIPVQYDMVRDQVVIKRLGQNFKISLISEKLTSFFIHGHDFIRISQDSVHGVELVSGFYDRTYAGKSTVLVKRRKYIKEVMEYSNTSQTYLEEEIFYVKSGDGFQIVNNKSSVLKLFRSKKSEIKSFLRKNKLSFSSDFEKTLIATAAYYDQLTS